jgi:hypothetical protein
MSERKREVSEKIQRLERQMADRMEEHHGFMERFITPGDHYAKENADRILHVWHKYKSEIAKLREQLNNPE